MQNATIKSLEAIKVVTSDRKSWCVDSKCWWGGGETGKDRDNCGELPLALNVTTPPSSPGSQARLSGADIFWHVYPHHTNTGTPANSVVHAHTNKWLDIFTCSSFKDFQDSLNVSMHSQYLSGYLLISTLHCFCCNQQPTQILILYQNLQICDFVIFS